MPSVSQITSDRARQLLGPLFCDDSIYCSVPDLPFPEAEVIKALRAWAIRESATCVQVDEAVAISPNVNSRSGVVVNWNGNSLASKVTVLAAGAGNAGLLESLGVDHQTVLQQTPLLVVHGTHSIAAPIFNDRVGGYSLVRHSNEPKSLPDGGLVIATRVQRMVSFAPAEERRIDEADIEEFIEFLPEPLKPLPKIGRFTAGFEVVPKPELNRPYVAPWIRWCEDFPGLVHAMPGRATLGLSVARELLDEIELKIGAPSKSRRPQLTSDWNEEIHMHFHQQYDFDDRNLPNGGK